MRLLAFQHVARENPAYIAEYARERDIDLDIVELWKPYAMPKAKDYDALVILGGPMGVYDDFPSKDDELTFVEGNMGKLPMLGICLGAQLIAHTLGGRVWNEPSQKEIGHYDISLTDVGAEHDIFEGFEPRFTALLWHSDIFDVPQGAKLLATGTSCRNQAFAKDNAYGVLFHLEFTPAMVRECLEADKEWMYQQFDLNEKKLTADADRHAPAMRSRCFRLLDNFLSA